MPSPRRAVRRGRERETRSAGRLRRKSTNGGKEELFPNVADHVVRRVRLVAVDELHRAPPSRLPQLVSELVAFAEEDEHIHDCVGRLLHHRGFTKLVQLLESEDQRIRRTSAQLLAVLTHQCPEFQDYLLDLEIGFDFGPVRIYATTKAFLGDKRRKHLFLIIKHYLRHNSLPPTARKSEKRAFLRFVESISALSIQNPPNTWCFPAPALRGTASAIERSRRLNVSLASSQAHADPDPATSMLGFVRVPRPSTTVTMAEPGTGTPTAVGSGSGRPATAQGRRARPRGDTDTGGLESHGSDTHIRFIESSGRGETTELRVSDLESPRSPRGFGTRPLGGRHAPAGSDRQLRELHNRRVNPDSGFLPEPVSPHQGFVQVYGQSELVMMPNATPVHSAHGAAAVVWDSDDEPSSSACAVQAATTTAVRGRRWHLTAEDIDDVFRRPVVRFSCQLDFTRFHDAVVPAGATPRLGRRLSLPSGFRPNPFVSIATSISNRLSRRNRDAFEARLTDLRGPWEHPEVPPLWPHECTPILEVGGPSAIRSPRLMYYEEHGRQDAPLSEVTAAAMEAVAEAPHGGHSHGAPSGSHDWHVTTSNVNLSTEGRLRRSKSRDLLRAAERRARSFDDRSLAAALDTHQTSAAPSGSRSGSDLGSARRHGRRGSIASSVGGSSAVSSMVRDDDMDGTHAGLDCSRVRATFEKTVQKASETYSFPMGPVFHLQLGPQAAEYRFRSHRIGRRVLSLKSEGTHNGHVLLDGDPAGGAGGAGAADADDPNAWIAGPKSRVFRSRTDEELFQKRNQYAKNLRAENLELYALPDQDEEVDPYAAMVGVPRGDLHEPVSLALPYVSQVRVAAPSLASAIHSETSPIKLYRSKVIREEPLRVVEQSSRDLMMSFQNLLVTPDDKQLPYNEVDGQLLDLETQDHRKPYAMGIMHAARLEAQRMRPGSSHSSRSDASSRTPYVRRKTAREVFVAQRATPSPGAFNIDMAKDKKRIDRVRTEQARAKAARRRQRASLRRDASLHRDRDTGPE